MTVRHRSDKGSWLYRFKHALRVYEQSGFATRRAAQTAEWTRRGAVGALGARSRGGRRGGRDVTLSQYAPTWLTTIADQLAPATLRNYRERLESHVLPTLGAVRLRELQRSHVTTLLNARREAGNARDSVRLVRAALSALCSDAVEAGLMHANPCLQLSRRRRRAADTLTTAERQQRIRPMSLEQRDAFLATADTTAPARAALFELLAKAGLRPSEAFALRVDDVDFDRGRVLVERAWVLGALKSTKSHEVRLVELAPGLIETLRTQRATARSDALEHRWEVPAEGLWLFPNGEGHPLDEARVRRAFRSVCRAAQLPRFRLYDLRHTYASLRLAANAPITYVAAQLGHRSPATTLRFYARWIPSEGGQWVEQDQGAAPAAAVSRRPDQTSRPHDRAARAPSRGRGGLRVISGKGGSRGGSEKPKGPKGVG